MKKLLGLVLLFILVAGISLVFLMSRSNVGSGNWDLNSPANNSFIASFAALVRANQAAIVASITPPISWTSEATGGGSGSASAKLGFYGDEATKIPTFFLGSLLGSSGVSSYAVIMFGAPSDYPTGYLDNDGLFSFVYDNDDKMLSIFPPGVATNPIQLTNEYLSMGDAFFGGSRKISGVADGVLDSDAVNLGQLNDITNEEELIYGIDEDDIGLKWSKAVSWTQNPYGAAYCGNDVVIFGGTINASGVGNLIRSDDNGTTWGLATISCSAGDIAFVSIVPCGDGGVVLACTDASFGKIYRSSDYGVNWIVATDTESGNIYDFVYCGSGLVFSNAYGGDVYKSFDYGLTWESIATHSETTGNSIEYCGNGILLSGGEDLKISRSSDFGLTWNIATSTSSSEVIRDIKYLGNGVVIACSSHLSTGRIMRSGDSGLTWTMVYPSTAGNSFRRIAYCNDGIVLVSRQESVNFFRSVNYGLSWEESYGGIQNTSEIIFGADNVAFCRGTNAIYKSSANVW
jgi:hypothetical protein